MPIWLFPIFFIREVIGLWSLFLVLKDFIKSMVICIGEFIRRVSYHGRMNSPIQILNQFNLLSALFFPMVLMGQTGEISSQNDNRFYSEIARAASTQSAGSSNHTTNPNTLLQLLEEHLEKGDIIALRDLGKLYDKKSKQEQVIQLLKRYTLFTKSEWDWENISKNNGFLDFFYEKADSFRFSELLKVFYLTPIENRTATFEIDPKSNQPIDPKVIRNSVRKIDHHLRKKNFAPLLAEITQIGALNKPTVRIVLANLLDKKELLAFKESAKLTLISNILTYLPDSIAYEKIVKLTKKEHLPLTFCQQELALATNNFFIAKDHQSLVRDYQKLFTSFDNNLSLIKEYGFQKAALTPALFFEEKVDYYGWLAATCKDSLFWIKRNAILEMLATQHPKSLFYIAGLNFSYWKKHGKNDPYLFNLLDQNIDVIIKIKGNASWVVEPKALSVLEQLTHYWSIHYEDYEWDDFEQKFVNQELFSNELAAYDRYFRRLNSTNDTVAYKAFIALSEGKPHEIHQLIKKFKPLLRNYNISLPPLKYRILEQISLLSYFCQKHNINYIPNSELTQDLTKLANDLMPNERWKLENKLIHALKENDFTTLEYHAAIHAQNLPLNYSIGRILDYLYTKNWKKIIADEHQFRLYLLKVQLFKDFGGFGFSRKYEEKVNVLNATTFNALQNLQKIETNSYIQESITYFLERKNENTAKKIIAKFLAAPAELDKEGIESLPPFSLQDVPKIMQGLFLQEDKKATRKIGSYLELYASVEMIPALFNTPEEYWNANKNAGIALVEVLEKIYQFSFSAKKQESIKKWWVLWNTMPEIYADWSAYLFRQQLAYLRTEKILTINDLNSVTQSDLYREDHRNLCLKSLSKIDKSRTIYRLKIEPLLSVEKELSFIEHIDFSPKELGNLPKLFDIENANKLVDFIFEKSTTATIEEKSALYNRLFRQSWFIDHITKGQIDSIKCNAIKLVFYKYLSQSTFLTEYEEQNTQLNIVHLENAFLSLKEKLDRISKDSLNEAIRYNYLNATLSKIEFPEIIIALPILKDLTIANKNLFLFFNRDFGLPIFDIPTEKVAQKIITRLKNNNEYEFYEQTLVDFGLPILTKSETLDFQKIYEILSYDLVVPFLGEGGKYRDYYNYGLVKLLELHFKTTLGFHPKLNENQAFYTFNSYRRVVVWKDFLLKENLVKTNDLQSFKK